MKGRSLLFLEEAGIKGLTQQQLSTRLGIFGNKLKKQLQQPISSGTILVIDSERQRLLAAPVLRKLTSSIRNEIERYHQENPLKTGLAMEELKSGLKPPVDQKLFQYALGSMAKAGVIVQDQAEVRLADFEVTLQVDEEQLKDEIITLYRQSGLTPPNFKDVVISMGKYPEKQVRQVLNLLLQEQKIIKINESLYFLSDELDKLAGQVTDFIRREGEIDAPRFKKLTGLTRKFSIPLLEYFDKIKLTIRIDDKRVLRKVQ